MNERVSNVVVLQPQLHVAAGFWVVVFGCVNERVSNVVVLRPEFHVAVPEALKVDGCVLVRFALTVFSWSGGGSSVVSCRMATFM